MTDPAVLEQTLLRFMSQVALGVFVPTLVATWGIETPGQRPPLSRSVDRDDAIILGAAWRLMTSSSQGIAFYIFLLALSLAAFL